MSWQVLNNYVLLAKAGFDSSLHFVGRHPSDDNERRAAIRTIAASVVDRIDKEAINRLNAFPKPNEAASWAELGVADDNLFPPELLKTTRDAEKSLKKGSVLDDCNRRKAWERVTPQGPIVDGRRDGQRELPSWTTSLIVLHALSDKKGPFHHLAPLVYLASHARVPFMRVAAIDLPMLSPGPIPPADDDIQDNNNNTIHVDFGHSKPIPALQKFAIACLSQWIFLSILESLENGAETFANGMCRDMPVFPRDMGSYFLEVGPVHRRVQPHYEPGSMLMQGFTGGASRGLKNKKNPGRFHYDFWSTETDGKRSEHDPAARLAYKDRCLDIFIAYRTLMLAAHQRNSSVGDREFTTLAAERLTFTSVREVLTRLGYPFSGALSESIDTHNAIEAIMEELLATTRAEVETTEADIPTKPAVQTSPFLKLPPEIIFDDIASLLPVQAVYNLVRTCSRLRQILLPQVYADTCQVLQPALAEAASGHGGANDIKLLARIAKHNQLLLATPYLRGHVRHAQTMRVFTLPPVRDFRHFDASIHQLPLFCPLAKSFTNLVSASLSVNDLTADPQAVVAPDFLCKLVVHLVRTYPKLRSLELLLYLSEPMGGLIHRHSHPINDASTMAEVANIELPNGPALTVQDFSVRVLDNPMYTDPVNAHAFGGMTFDGFDPALSPALPRLAMMMASSVRYLELDVFDDILTSIPALPHVITLELKTGLSSRVLENVLRDSFPNLARLLLTYRPVRRSVAPAPAPGGGPGGAPPGMNAGLMGGMQGLLNGILGGPLPVGAVQAGAGVIQGPFLVPGGGGAGGGVFPGGFGGGGGHPANDGPGAISFASCLPHLKRMAISGYEAKSLPGGVETLVLLSEDLLLRATEPPRFVSASVTRVTLDPPNEDEPVPNAAQGNPFGQRRQPRTATGPQLFGAGLGGLVAAYPGMKCIELYELPRGVSWRLEKADDVYAIVGHIESLIPGLEALVLTLPRFAYRPKRVDYPVDDGLDIEERELAINVFMMAPSLKYLSVTGLDFWDTTWMRRRRTWVQTPMPGNHNRDQGLEQGNNDGQDQAEEEGEDELYCRCWSDQYGEHRDLFKVSAVYGKGGLPDFVTGAKPLQGC
ncbi:hypothetical protein CYLTODRAFT_493579 [Cylindrobasidium torrendii FP15055 ss-10]|uniref:F-box domain-containing protein n=1 Tax=Cylindrobasidium torrendii FP15055 ss-10 TaxID=1314674 RepID=A0A0D7AZR3_9AGAR|nr:hypothetical protein CYLTODRAFT_493579 [Cylindrobasidium torrendii FP15055 ss-10]